MNQLEVEKEYSRKNIRSMVMLDIDYESPVYQECLKVVHTFRNGEYYTSKNIRLQNLSLTTSDIVTELFIAILTLDRPTPIQAVATKLSSHMDYQEILDGIKTAAEIIAVCEDSGLYELWHSKDPNNPTDTLAVVPKYKLDEETQQRINKTMYLPPMLEKPVDWTSNNKGGTLSGSGSAILGRLNHHSFKQDLETLNIMQSIPWEINEYMLSFEEKSKKPLDTDLKRMQFELMRDISRNVAEFLIEEGNEFYFTWKNDKRGRMNCQGYHINLQSTDYKKSVINFKNKELVV